MAENYDGSVNWSRNFTFKKSDFRFNALKPPSNFEDNPEVDNQNFANEEENFPKDNFYERDNIGNQIEEGDGDEIPIDLIMSQIKKLSNQQIFLLDSIQKFKENSNKIINDKQRTITLLEKRIKYLRKEIEEALESQKGDSYNKGFNNFRSYGSGNSNEGEYNNDTKDINYDLNEALSNLDDKAVMKIIFNAELNQLRIIKITLLEKCILFLFGEQSKYCGSSNLTSKKIKFLKSIILGIKAKISQKTRMFIKNYLSFILDNQSELSNSLNENDLFDANLILENLTEYLGK
ncbi:MAG: hypothetical protein MJ252_00385, partial [archaeon]|nr:hypothetical protein [archaeon]